MQDRVIREMIFRDKTERVAHVRAFATVAARLMGMDVDRLFSDVISDYASEVFGESYNPDLLRQKADSLREAQRRIREKREKDESALKRLERMGDYADKAASRKKAK